MTPWIFPTDGSISLGTASPNFTLKEELFQGIRTKDDLILIDLAVPRDIEPSVGKIQGVTLYDMDSFRIEEVPAELQENLEAAGAIVREQMDEFFQWLDGRDLIPRIQDIKDEAVNDLNLRIAKILKKTPMEEDDRQNLVHAVDTAAGKVVNKLIFGLRDSLNQEIFLECVAGLISAISNGWGAASIIVLKNFTRFQLSPFKDPPCAQKIGSFPC